MDWFIKAFIRASLVWFTLGIALGLAMSAYPPWVVYRPAHAHLNVVGFLTMMLFGVGYQLLPRIFGHQIHRRGLAIAHWWLANLGLAAMVTGFLIAPHVGRASAWVTTTGGTLFSLGALSFVYNMWRTFDAADARYRARAVGPAAQPPRKLPTMDG
jgi:cbb3-type cytochrome oxidase subunit 1